MRLCHLEFWFILGGCLSTYLCFVFGEISSSCSSHHWHQYDIFIIYFFHYLNMLYLPVELFYYLPVSRTFVRLFCRSDLYFLIFYSGDFIWTRSCDFYPSHWEWSSLSCVFINLFICYLKFEFYRLWFITFFLILLNRKDFIFHHMIWIIFFFST